MKFNFFIEVDNDLVDISNIEQTSSTISEDWYYLSGSIEITDTKGNEYTSRNDKTDIVPFAYEFFTLFLSLFFYQKSNYKNSLPFCLSDKVSTRTSLYHPVIHEIGLYIMNDVDASARLFYLDVVKNINFEHDGFIDYLNFEFSEFYKAVKTLYPNTKIAMLEEVKIILDTW